MAGRHRRWATRARTSEATPEQLALWADLVTVCRRLADAPKASVGDLNRLARMLSEAPVPGWRPGIRVSADDAFIRLIGYARVFAGHDAFARPDMAAELGRRVEAAAVRQAELDAATAANPVRQRVDIFG